MFTHSAWRTHSMLIAFLGLSWGHMRQATIAAKCMCCFGMSMFELMDMLVTTWHSPRLCWVACLS